MCVKWLTRLTSNKAGGSGTATDAGEATEATFGGSFATLVAFLARFLSAAANEDVLEAAELTTEAAEVGATTAADGGGG